MSINMTSAIGAINLLSTLGINHTSPAPINSTSSLINHLAIIKNLNPGAASGISSLSSLSTQLNSLVSQVGTALGVTGFLSQATALTSSLGQLQSIAGSFGSITSIAQATAAFGQLNSVLGSISGPTGFLSNFGTSFAGMSGIMGNLTGLSGTFSSLTNISSLSGITGALTSLAGISSLSGLSSISSLTSTLQSVQSLTNSVGISAGFFDPTGTLGAATTLLSNINTTLLGSSVVSDLTSQSTTLNDTLSGIQAPLTDVQVALAPYA